MVKLIDTIGTLIYGVTSITSVATAPVSGSPVTLVQGTDWDVVSLERGLIKLYSASTNFTTAGNLTVTYVPRAITDANAQRLLYPQTAGAISGTGLIVWGRGVNTRQTVREARFSLTPNGSTFSDTNYSESTMDMVVLNDLTQPVPAGRLLYWLGNCPPLS